MKERLSVSWQQHPLNLVEAINDLHDKDVFCDVTVVCDGEYFPAHRLVLCSQSDYFRELLERAPCRHPFIILRDTTAEDFDALMQFIYKGSVEVPKEKVSSLMKAGTDMKIKGLYSSEDSDDEKTMKRTKERPCVREPQCILGNIPKDKSSHKSFSRESRHSLSQSAQPADEPNRIGEPQSPSEHLNEDSGHEGHEVHYVHYTESSSSLPSDESQATVRKEVSSTKASQRHHKKRSFEMQEKTTSSSQAQNPVESSSEAKRFRFSTSEGNETSQTQDPLRGDSSQAMNILTQNIKTEMVDISDHAEGTAGEGVNPEEEHYSREPGSDDNPASPSSNAASEPLRSDITKNDLKMEDTFLEFPTELDFVFNTEETMSALQERGSSNRATITPVSSKDSVSTSNHQRSMAKEGDYGNEPSVSKYSSEGMKKVRKNRSSAEALQLATVEVIEEMEASDNEEIHDDPSSVVSTELQQPSTSGVRRKGPPLNPGVHPSSAISDGLHKGILDPSDVSGIEQCPPTDMERESHPPPTNTNKNQNELLDYCGYFPIQHFLTLSEGNANASLYERASNVCSSPGYPKPSTSYPTPQTPHVESGGCENIQTVTPRDFDLPPFSTYVEPYLRGETGLDQITIRAMKNQLVDELIEYLNSSNLLISKSRILQSWGYRRLAQAILTRYPNIIKEPSKRAKPLKGELAQLMALVAERRRKRANAKHVYKMGGPYEAWNA